MKTKPLSLAISFGLVAALAAQQSDLSSMTPKQRGEYFTRIGASSTPDPIRRPSDEPEGKNHSKYKLRELPQKSIGAGTTDSYILGVSISDTSTRFFLTVSAIGVVDTADVKAMIDGEEMPVVVKSSRKENGKTFFFVSAELTKPQISKVSTSGASVEILSGGKKAYAFLVQKIELDELIKLQP